MVESINPSIPLREVRSAAVSAGAPAPKVADVAVDRDPQSATAAAGQLARDLATAPPVDGERVARIRKAIADGTFPILPATIADRLLALRMDWLSNDAA
ncbi:flagellar biosynthesis anti-sigma factor FlgM [uncultured Sphingomonas sp.]|uniref:flagellar biosynthesis anti-sigma factor FlgM n=1 Tax=uncultured Sphingomonas sp. TaxID=158754 RepID=UPI0035CA484A